LNNLVFRFETETLKKNYPDMPIYI
jgi:hypothetical protein